MCGIHVRLGAEVALSATVAGRPCARWECESLESCTAVACTWLGVATCSVANNATSLYGQTARTGKLWCERNRWIN